MISITPIGTVKNDIEDLSFQDWELAVSEIELSEPFSADSFNGIEQYSLLQIIFYFHRSDRFNLDDYIKKDDLGIFANQNYLHPNKLGVSIVKLLRKKNKSIIVQGLDAINGTPVIDIKPFSEKSFTD